MLAVALLIGVVVAAVVAFVLRSRAHRRERLLAHLAAAELTVLTCKWMYQPYRTSLGTHFWVWVRDAGGHTMSGHARVTGAPRLRIDVTWESSVDDRSASALDALRRRLRLSVRQAPSRGTG